MRTRVHVLLCIITSLTSGNIAFGGILLSEDFEDSILAPGLTVSTTGTFISGPGIKAYAGLNGSQAFGFGLSTNLASSFFAYQTTLTLQFIVPTYVDSVSFIEREAFENWGSQGAFYVSGDYVPTQISDPVVQAGLWGDDFGRLPHNDHIADTAFRSRTIHVDKVITSLSLQVWDITNLSEIYIDDLLVTGTAFSPVPEPSTLSLCGIALIVGFASHRIRRSRATSRSKAVPPNFGRGTA